MTRDEESISFVYPSSPEFAPTVGQKSGPESSPHRKSRQGPLHPGCSQSRPKPRSFKQILVTNSLPKACMPLPPRGTCLLLYEEAISTGAFLFFFVCPGGVSSKAFSIRPPRVPSRPSRSFWIHQTDLHLPLSLVPVVMRHMYFVMAMPLGEREALRPHFFLLGSFSLPPPHSHPSDRRSPYQIHI